MDAAYLDSYGLPGDRQSDGTLDMGDSAAIYFNILALSQEPDDKANNYYSVVPLRHPDKSKWWGQPDRCSRDQLIPMLCYAIKRDIKTKFIKEVFVSHLKRLLLLAWNIRGDGAMVMPLKFPDITGPEIFGLWLRVFKPFGYRIMLPFCDIETLVNALLWKYYQPITNQITRNHMLVCITQRKYPSITSRLADKINDYNDLVTRWQIHCAVTGEYPTADLFKAEVL